MDEIEVVFSADTLTGVEPLTVGFESSVTIYDAESSGVGTTAPASSTRDWGAMVRRTWGDAWLQREVVYVFSDGRKFNDSGPNSGIYGD